jgi:hypothetical protein
MKHSRQHAAGQDLDRVDGPGGSEHREPHHI